MSPRDKLERYREIVRRLIEEYAGYKPANGQIETEAVMEVGKDLYIGDADINLHTAMVALGNLPQDSPSRSSFSTSSR